MPSRLTDVRSPSRFSDQPAPFADPVAPAGGLETEIIAAYLDQVEQRLAARLDARLAQDVADTAPEPGRGMGSFTLRIATSLTLGIPLTAVAGEMGGHWGRGGGAMACVFFALVTLVGLNVYYTEVERSLEKDRRRTRRP